jgi:hypothetical protein
VGDDAADSAGSDDEDFVHGKKKHKGWEKCGHWQEILPIRLEMAQTESVGGGIFSDKF